MVVMSGTLLHAVTRKRQGGDHGPTGGDLAPHQAGDQGVLTNHKVLGDQARHGGEGAMNLHRVRGLRPENPRRVPKPKDNTPADKDFLRG